MNSWTPTADEVRARARDGFSTGAWAKSADGEVGIFGMTVCENGTVYAGDKHVKSRLREGFAFIDWVRTPSEIAAIRREERERAAVRILLADGSSEAEARRVVGDIRAGKKEWDDLSDLDETDRAVVAALGEDE